MNLNYDGTPLLVLGEEGELKRQGALLLRAKTCGAITQFIQFSEGEPGLGKVRYLGSMMANLLENLNQFMHAP